MAESLFTTQTPAVTDATDATAYTLGTKFSSSSVGSITHGRWYFPATAPSGPVSFVLYDEVTEVELARAMFTGSGAGWRTVALPSPVAYSTPGTVLVAAVETPNRYVATVNFFSSGALVNGSLTAPGDGDNGRLGVGFVYPSLSSSDTAYFVDVVFEPAGAGPAQGSAVVGLDLAVAAAGGRVSAGSADLGVGFAVDASGLAPAVAAAAGAVDLGLTLSVAAHGRTLRGGAAGLPRGETAVILRAPLADGPYGNQERDWANATRTDSYGWGFAPRSNESTTSDSPSVIVGLTGYGPAGVDILPTDRMEVRGEVYEVEGEVGEWRSPFTGWEPGVEVALRRVYIAEG